jgi:hypothetical protein
MNRFKVQLSKFDIVMLIAFVVVGLCGAAAWWVLSGQLQTAQAACAQVAGDYNSYATSKGSGIIVSQPNAKALQANSDLLQAQLDPVMSTYLLSKDNDLSSVRAMDPVGWKKELDDDIKTLTADAKGRSITLPEHFYFGFSRYQTEQPGDAATAVLTKQRKAIKALSEILIGAQIKSITRLQRSYEEDAHGGSGNEHPEGDQISGSSVVVPDTYTAYPFEVDFDASPEALRPILSGLIKSPYLFVLRSMEVHNEQVDSPKLDDLPKMAAGNGSPSVINSDPGAAAQSTPTVGPQKLFGYATLHVKMRVDMIEWNPDLKSVADLVTTPKKKQP